MFRAPGRTTSSEPFPGRALVTGAAGAIGAAVARLLSERGVALVLVDRERERLERVAAELQPSPELVVADLADRAALAALQKRFDADLSDVELLVNNAGVIRPGRFIELETDDLDFQLDVNLRAAIKLAHAAARAMARRGRGSIVNLVSMGGIIAMRNSAAYCASKFGLRGFTQALALELCSSNVRVSGVYPAAVDTPLLEHEMQSGGSSLNFVGALSTPEDVARAVLRAASGGDLEVYVPYTDSFGARLLAAFPWLFARLEPVLERLGERGRRRYLARITRAPV